MNIIDTQPAVRPKPRILARAGLGVTANLGNYENLKVEVTCESNRILNDQEKTRAQRLIAQMLELSEGAIDGALEQLSQHIQFDKASRFSVNVTKGRTRGN